MIPKERVINQILGRGVDRVPLMGGWFHGVANLAALAGLSEQEYLADPTEGLLAANRAHATRGVSRGGGTENRLKSCTRPTTRSFEVM